MSQTSAQATVQLDNEKVIVTRWDFSPGAQTGWHRHDLDYLVVPIMDGVMRLQTSDGSHESSVKAGETYQRPTGVEHNVINAGKEHFAFVEIEFKFSQQLTNNET